MGNTHQHFVTIPNENCCVRCPSRKYFSLCLNIFPCCGQVKQEVGVLVATQMGFCVVGVFLNNVAFITLKELPSMRASTYNILLCHIVLGTLLHCS